MPAQAVDDAVLARLRAGWSTTPIFNYNVTGDTPADGSPFVSVDYPVVNENQITIGAPGNNVFREEGTIRVRLSYPRGKGIRQAWGYVDTLRALLRSASFSGVVTWAAGGPALDDSAENGNYVVLSFVTPYYFDLFG